jgi:hypothetical protein
MDNIENPDNNVLGSYRKSRGREIQNLITESICSSRYIDKKKADPPIPAILIILPPPLQLQPKKYLLLLCCWEHTTTTDTTTSSKESYIMSINKDGQNKLYGSRFLDYEHTSIF